MLLPLDRRINNHLPVATIGLVAVNALCFFVSFAAVGGYAGVSELWDRWGFTPGSPTLPTTVTHMFIHANWEHLAGNMVMLTLMGMNCERKLGTALTLGLYFLSGFGALALFVFFNSESTEALGGASGAVSGVAGTYFALFARREVDVIWFIGCAGGTIKRVGAWTFTLLWGGLEIVQAALLNDIVQVAHWAHAGGFLVGLGGVAILVRLCGYRGRPENQPPGAVAPARSARYDELSYIPVAPGEEAEPRKDEALYVLVARHFDPPSPAARKFLPPGPVHPACVSRPLPFLEAQSLQDRLKQAGYAVFMHAGKHVVELPPIRLATSVRFEDRVMILEDEVTGRHERGLSSLYLASAGRVATPSGERTFLDLFATSPWTDIRIEPADAAAMAREILAQCTRLPMAKTLAALARDGRIEGGPFADLERYDAFNRWMLQVHASGIFRDNKE